MGVGVETERLQYPSVPLGASVVSVTVCLKRKVETEGMGDESDVRAC